MPIAWPISFKPLNTADFGKLDYSVMSCAFAIHKELGRLADEEIYQGDFAARLYHQAVIHLLGGVERVAFMLPMTRNGMSLGNQRFFLSNPQSAFRLTAFSGRFGHYKSHLERLLRHSPLSFIHWINIDLETVTFTTITRAVG